MAAPHLARSLTAPVPLLLPLLAEQVDLGSAFRATDASKMFSTAFRALTYAITAAEGKPPGGNKKGGKSKNAGKKNKKSGSHQNNTRKGRRGNNNNDDGDSDDGFDGNGGGAVARGVNGRAGVNGGAQGGGRGRGRGMQMVQPAWMSEAHLQQQHRQQQLQAGINSGGGGPLHQTPGGLQDTEPVPSPPALLPSTEALPQQQQQQQVRARVNGGGGLLHQPPGGSQDAESVRLPSAGGGGSRDENDGNGGGRAGEGGSHSVSGSVRDACFTYDYKAPYRLVAGAGAGRGRGRSRPVSGGGGRSGANDHPEAQREEQPEPEREEDEDSPRPRRRRSSVLGWVIWGSDLRRERESRLAAVGSTMTSPDPEGAFGGVFVFFFSAKPNRGSCGPANLSPCQQSNHSFLTHNTAPPPGG